MSPFIPFQPQYLIRPGIYHGLTHFEQTTGDNHNPMHQVQPLTSSQTHETSLIQQCNISQPSASLDACSEELKDQTEIPIEIPKINPDLYLETEIKKEEGSSLERAVQGHFKPYSDHEHFLVLMRGSFYCLNCRQKWLHSHTLDFIKHIWLYHLHEDYSLASSNAKFSLDSDELQSILRILQERTSDLELSNRISNYICKQEKISNDCVNPELPADQKSRPMCHQTQITNNEKDNSRACLQDMEINIDPTAQGLSSPVLKGKKDLQTISSNFGAVEKEKENESTVLESFSAGFHKPNTPTPNSNCLDFYHAGKIGPAQDILPDKAQESGVSPSEKAGQCLSEESDLQKSEDLATCEDYSRQNAHNQLNSKGNAQQNYRHLLSSFYQCGFFDCVFSSHLPVDLLIHNENDHPLESEIPCVYCGKIHKTVSGLLEHLDSHVGQNGLKVMHSCSLVCDSKAVCVVDHRNRKKIFDLLKTVAEKKKVTLQGQVDVIQYRCNSCCSDFLSLEDLRLHLNKSMLKVVACKYCRGQFLDTESWHEHMSKDHQCEVRQYRINEKLLCKDRKQNASTYQTLLSQRKAFRTRLHQPQSEKCDTKQSGNHFAENKDCTNHFAENKDTVMTIEREELSVPIYFKCSMCPLEKFSSYFLAKKHKTTHSDNGATIRRFSNSHFDPSKQYKCNYCAYVCTGTKSHMLRHLRSDHKFFVCGHCGNDYANIRFLRNHLKYGHPGEDVNIVERYPRLRNAFNILAVIKFDAEIIGEKTERGELNKKQVCSRKRHCETEMTDQFSVKRKLYGYDNVGAASDFHDDEVTLTPESEMDVRVDKQCDHISSNNSDADSDFASDVPNDLQEVQNRVRIVKITRVRSLCSPGSNKPLEIRVAPYIFKLFGDAGDQIYGESSKISTPKCHMTANKLVENFSSELKGQRLKVSATHGGRPTVEKQISKEDSPPDDKAMKTSDFPFQCNNCKVCMKSIQYVLDHSRWLHPSDQNNILVYDRRSHVTFTKDGLVKGSRMDADLPKQRHLCKICSFCSTSRIDVCDHAKTKHSDKDGDKCVLTLHGLETSPSKSEGDFESKASSSGIPLPSVVVSEELQRKEKNGLDLVKRRLEDLTPQKPAPPTSLKFRCHLCPEKLCNEFYFKLHLARHEGFTCTSVLSSLKGLLLCSVCGYIAGSNNDLAQHTDKHLTERRYACSLCDTDGHKKTSVQIHIRKYHNGAQGAQVIDREARGFVEVRPKIVDIDPSLKVMDIFKIPMRHLNKRLRQSGVKSLLIDSSADINFTNYKHFFNINYI
ncbi:hypothetical protein EGW08_001272 [Elysia chlorotica]|uniref:C2H2-type domain-containing protein n=1 Tax=Elysia chlorotica TaxID=188477 RepID=A0A3S1BTI1_ELYCH|nr:hypothetical protein EGW08_001272 [Elysia chlorotica]